MSDKLPFEDAFEAHMNNMQPPFEDESWQKMKALLDEKERRRPFAFFIRSGFLAIVVLVVVLLSSAIIFFHGRSQRAAMPSADGKHNSHLQQAPASADNATASNKKVNTVTNKATVQNETTNAIVDSGIATNNATAQIKLRSTAHISDTTEAAKEKVVLNHKEEARHSNANIHVANTSKTVSAEKGYLTTAKVPAKVKANTKVRQQRLQHILLAQQHIAAVRHMQPQLVTTSPSFITGQSRLSDNAPDSLSTIPDSALSHSNTVTYSSRIGAETIAKSPTKTRNKKYTVAAGAGLEQPLPVVGQSLSAINANGNRHLLADYIPSLYLQVHKGGHWFVQTGFNYAAPQLVRQFPFTQQTVANFAATTYTVHAMVIKKTYYNQVPVSFNYYVRPAWSVGAGAMYSWLHSAVAESTTETTNVLNQQQTGQRQTVVIKGFTDSFLYRSHTYALLQTAYDFNRFSFGLRLAKDLQPYIKYTLPDGTVQTQRNWALDFTVRFRLYRSGSFSLFGAKAGKKKQTGVAARYAVQVSDTTMLTKAKIPVP